MFYTIILGTTYVSLSCTTIYSFSLYNNNFLLRLFIKTLVIYNKKMLNSGICVNYLNK